MSPAYFAITSFVIGLLVGLNPTLLGIFNTYVASLKGNRKSNKYYTLYGALFICLFIVSIVLIGSLLDIILSVLSLKILNAIGIFTALASMVISLNIISGYFFDATPLAFRPLSLLQPKLHKYAIKESGLLVLSKLIIITLLIMLPSVVFVCLGLAVSSASLGYSVNVWLWGFAIATVSPIYTILASLSNHTRAGAIFSWIERIKPSLYLSSGLSLAVVGWVILYSLIIASSK